jgi:hypothetical protein
MPLRYERAAVGSTNPAKLEAVHRALARLAPGCAVESVDVPSGVGRQPFGDEETRTGARMRARSRAGPRLLVAEGLAAHPARHIHAFYGAARRQSGERPMDRFELRGVGRADSGSRVSERHLASYRGAEHNTE